MKVTVKQAHVLENLHRVVHGSRKGKAIAFLDGEDCRMQINALGARGLISRNPLGRPVKIAEPDGILKDRGRPRAGKKAGAAGEVLPAR